MVKMIQKTLPALILFAVSVFASSLPEPVFIVPLLPDDNGNKVAFTKQSFKELISEQKKAARTLMPLLSSGSSSMSNESAVKKAVAYLLGSKMTRTGNYLEGLPPSIGGLPNGWPYMDGGTKVARSTYGEIGLALLAAYRHDQDPSLLTEIRAIAANLKTDYNHGGPLVTTNKPFIPDIIFLAEFENSGLNNVDTDYITYAAEPWLDRIIGDGNQQAADAEVNRIVAARTTQNAKELVGYDIALLYIAATSLGNGNHEEENHQAFASHIRNAYNSLEGSWEDGAGNNDSVRASTGNMLSRGAVVASGILTDHPPYSAWLTFLAGTQRMSDGIFNSYDSKGSFLPAGNIQSNSWIIVGLKEESSYYSASIEGCRYLLRTQLLNGAWYSFPLFAINDIYPNEVAAALSALCDVFYTMEVTHIYDREHSVLLGKIPVQLKNFSGDTTLKGTSSGKVTFYAILDQKITVSFPISSNLANTLRASFINGMDASLVLEQALKTTPFGTDDPSTYGTGSWALKAANLTKSYTFTHSNVNSQIAGEILRYAVGLPPQYTAYFTLNCISWGNPYLRDTLNTVIHDFNSKNETLDNNEAGYRMVLLGDISNSMAKKGGLNEPVLLAGASRAVSSMKLSLDDYQLKEGNLLLPVTISGFSNGMEVPRAFQFEVTYDAGALTYTGLRLGEVTGSFLYAENGTEPGLVKVAMASGTGVQVDGIIAYLEFKLIKSEAVPSGFSLAKIFINEMASIEETSSSATALKAPGEVSLPRTYSLYQNNPNPFNPSTTIQYSIPDSKGTVEVKLTVFNLRGQLVRTLVDMEQSAGSYTVQWDGLDQKGQRVSSGVYFYRLEAGTYSRTRKMVILK